MHGAGHRRKCPECGQGVSHIADVLSHRELRGPRQITSSNIDRIFDDNGRRILLIEEKRPDEPVGGGQHKLLRALAAIPEFTVWGVRGTPGNLRIKDIGTGALVAEGTWDDYQHAVDQWFASPPPPQRDWLAALGQAPYAAPAWCPPDIWAELDRAITEVLARRHNAA